MQQSPSDPAMASNVRLISSDSATAYRTWNGDNLGHRVAHLDQLAPKSKSSRSGGKPNYDLLEAEVDQKIEHTALAHRHPWARTSAWFPSSKIDAANQIGARLDSTGMAKKCERVNGPLKDGTCMCA